MMLKVTIISMSEAAFRARMSGGAEASWAQHVLDSTIARPPALAQVTCTVTRLRSSSGGSHRGDLYQRDQ